MHGLEPTHRQQLRKKQGIRLFLEERVLEIQELTLMFVALMINIYCFLKSRTIFVLNKIEVFLSKKKMDFFVKVFVLALLLFLSIGV